MYNPSAPPTEDTPLINRHEPVEPRVKTEGLVNQDRGWWHAYLAFSALFLGCGVASYFLSADNVEQVHTWVNEENPGAVGLALGIVLGMTPILGVSALIALFAGWVWYTLLKAFPVGMTWTSLLFWPCTAVLLGFSMFANGGPDEDVDVAGALVPILFMGGVPLLVIFCFRDRIKLTGMVIAETVKIISAYPSLLGYSVGVAVAYVPYAALGIWFTYRTALTGEFVTVDDPDYGETLTYELPTLARAILGVIAFHTYWTSSFLTNVQIATIGGVVGTHYFHGGDSSMTAGATRNSFKRATSTSLGSLFYGALISAIVQVIRNAMNQNRRGGRRNVGMVVLAIIIRCCLSCILAWIEFFTKYTVIHVALSGQNFCDSAKSTYEMLRRNLVSTVVVDRVLNMVMAGGKALVVICVGVFVYAVAETAAEHDEEINIITLVIVWMVTIFSVMLSGMVLSFVIRVVEAAANTVFVCYTIDKDNAVQTQPQIHQAYDGFAVIDQAKADQIYPKLS